MSTTTDTPSKRKVESQVVSKQNSYLPAFDIWKSDDRVILQGDVPGVDPADLELRFEEGTLKLQAKVAPRWSAANVVRREYGVGDYERHFSIGDQIDANGINAELRDGVITIVLPIAPKAQPRRIEVRTA